MTAVPAANASRQAALAVHWAEDGCQPGQVGRHGAGAFSLGERDAPARSRRGALTILPTEFFGSDDSRYTSRGTLNQARGCLQCAISSVAPVPAPGRSTTNATGPSRGGGAGSTPPRGGGEAILDRYRPSSWTCSTGMPVV